METPYQHSAISLMKQRTSCRTFRPENLQAIHKQVLEEFIGQNNRSFADQVIDLHIIEKEAAQKYEQKFSDYGLIRNHLNYMVGSINPELDYSYESYGYVLEKVVLKAADLGLGTCWVGVFNPLYLN